MQRLEELTMRAEQVFDAIDEQKRLNRIIEQYCTGKCKQCPLTKACLGEAEIDFSCEVTMEQCADYICLWDKERREQAELDAYLEEVEEMARKIEEHQGVTNASFGGGRYEDTQHS